MFEAFDSLVFYAFDGDEVALCLSLFTFVLNFGEGESSCFLLAELCLRDPSLE